MALSLANLCSFRLSALRAHRSDSAYPPKIPIQPKNKSLSLSSNCYLFRSPSNFHHHENSFKLASDDSRLHKAISIRAHNQVQAEGFGSPSEKSVHIGQVLWHFMRPLAIYFVLVQFFSVLAKTWMQNSHLIQSSTWSILTKAIAAAVAISCAHGFIYGVNEICDVEIDRINRPYLPIPSGALSIQTAWLLTVGFATIGLLLAGIVNSSLFLIGMGLIFFMGYAYNVPPLTLKCSTFGAIFSNGMTSGAVTLLCTHSGAKAALGLPFQIRTYDAFIFIFITIMALIGGFMKDLTDIEGDMKYNVPTLASKLGLRKTTFLGVGILLMTYIGGILAAISMPQAFKPIIIVPAHLFLSLVLILQVLRLEKANYTKEARTTFHKFLWTVGVLEFLVYLLM